MCIIIVCVCVYAWKYKTTNAGQTVVESEYLELDGDAKARKIKKQELMGFINNRSISLPDKIKPLNDIINYFISIKTSAPDAFYNKNAAILIGIILSIKLLDQNFDFKTLDNLQDLVRDEKINKYIRVFVMQYMYNCKASEQELRDIKQLTYSDVIDLLHKPINHSLAHKPSTK